jgi:hypothetical protein
MVFSYTSFLTFVIKRIEGVSAPINNRSIMVTRKLTKLEHRYLQSLVDFGDRSHIRAPLNLRRKLASIR